MIGDRTRDFPACNTVPQPTTLPRSPSENIDMRTKSITQNLLSPPPHLLSDRHRGQSMKFITHLRLLMRLIMSGTTPPLPTFYNVVFDQTMGQLKLCILTHTCDDQSLNKQRLCWTSAIVFSYLDGVFNISSL
jgi:hypothetical protein